MARRESRRWEADLTAPGGRRNRRSFSYETYIPDALAGFDPPLPAAVIARASEAERAIQALNLSPPRLASLETLARRLLRSEAVASSHIEGLRISHRRLARAEIAGAEEHDDTARAVLGNVQAMEAALALGAGERTLRLPDLLEIHGLLLRSTSRPGQAGRLRTTQNWIGRNPHSPAGADYVPPPPELVGPLLEDLVRYCNRTDVLPSIQAAVAHAQFETIHPFGDGNGRTGRALIHLLLRRRGLTPRFVPPVSLVLATRSQAYVRGLTSFRDGRVADWLDVFSEALLLATRHAEDLADEVERLQARWRAAAGSPRADSAAEALIRLLPSHPLLTVRSAEALLGRSFQSANTALASLERAGVVTQVSLGRRNRAFEAKELLQLVNVFERELATPDDANEPARPAPR